MTLIICPECDNQVSTRAVACPSCGCPIDQDSNQRQVPTTPRPDLAENLSIGRQVLSWSGNAVIKGYCDSSENSSSGIHNADVYLLIHKRGVQLNKNMSEPLRNIHFSQIIDIRYVARSAVYESGKSVVKRAAVGALILGPLGALVGGMSGIGTKQEQYKGYIVINYWDTNEDRPLTIMVAVNDDKIAEKFCARVSKETSAVKA